MARENDPRAVSGRLSGTAYQGPSTDVDSDHPHLASEKPLLCTEQDQELKLKSGNYWGNSHSVPFDDQ